MKFMAHCRNCEADVICTPDGLLPFGSLRGECTCGYSAIVEVGAEVKPRHFLNRTTWFDEHGSLAIIPANLMFALPPAPANQSGADRPAESEATE